jgi:TonB-linked SusC/RagA family outer membrane protein
MKRFTLSLMFFMAIGVSIWAQTMEITGTVTSSEDGQPMPGVAVLVQGTTIGASTDAQGKYTLTVPANTKTLEFRFVGMKSQEIGIAGRSTIDIVLQPETVGLQEIVVTALGISREKNALGYSVQKVDGGDLTRSGETDVINGLSAKVAGVQVISTAGTPGASAKILIRGNATLTGDNQPLIVVDGIPINNDVTQTVGNDYPFNQDLQGVNNSNRALDLNPDDIESVTVLKGPSAAALYGSKAASGAIIYTTKRGKAGEPKLVYGFSTQSITPNKLPDEQRLYVQGSWTDANADNSSTAQYQPGTTNRSWGPTYIDAGVPRYNNTKDFFQNGVTNTHDLSISGGSEKSLFRISLSRVDQSGIVPESKLDRTTLRVNTNSNVTNKFTISVSANYANTGTNMVQNGSNLSGVMLSLMRAPISYKLSDYQNPDGSNKNYFAAYDNPYWSVHNNPFTSRVNRFIANTVLDYKLTSWLDASYRVGADVFSEKRKQVFAIGANNISDQLGQIEDNTITNQEYYQDFIISADHKWMDKFSTGLKLGGNLQSTNNDFLYGRANQLSVPGFDNLSNGTTLYSNENQTITRTSSVFFDVSLGWSSYLYVDVTGRNDWSSTFGTAKNNFFYPAASLSFVFSELLPKNDIFTFGKLRIAVAQGGKPPVAYYTQNYYVAPFFADGFTNGNSFPFLGVNGTSPRNILGNPNLKPEKTVENEIGLDASFLQSRVGFEFTYYNKKSTDLLVLRPEPGSSGVLSKYSNVGSMSNKGVEFLVNLVPVKYEGFTWKIEGTYAKNVNKVLAVEPDQLLIATGFNTPQAFAIKGQPYGSLYGTAWQRNSKGQLLIGSNGLPMPTDTNINLGSPYPKWTAGIRNTFSWKGISLTVLFDFSHGGKAWDGTVARMYQLGRMAETVNREQTYVIPGVLADGTPNTKAISAFNYFRTYKGDAGAYATENAIYSTDWTRLREISLSYHLDLKNQWFKFIEISITGRNLWLKTDYPGVDPETSLTGAGSNIQGFDYFNNPSTKSYSFGIKFGLL